MHFYTMYSLKVLLTLSLVHFCVGFGSSRRAIPIVTEYCEHYNSSTCQSEIQEDCFEIKKCAYPEPEKRNHCFVLWKYDGENETVIQMKGCFLDNAQCYQTSCVEKRIVENSLYFCCCDGDNCNRNFTYDPVSTPFPNISVTKKESENGILLITILCVLIPLIILSITAVIIWWYRQKKNPDFQELPTADPPIPEPSPILEVRPIQLIEMKARGRFGAVYKARYKFNTVAVKIFPLQDKKSWTTEHEVFKLPHLSHDNILDFIGVEKRGEGLQAEFWLITAYHEKGSLCDYLKANVITWVEMCRIAETMARGLMHLHEEIPSEKPDQGKPAVAHRDFKSKNVLLKSDMSACIADFGLALIFEPGKPCGDTHGQVGTRRYMSPEVLEGAINFSRDSFLRIDMYACGLVLWELVSRCTAQDGLIPEYMLPFEEEIGTHPTLEDMQDVVVHKRQRPKIPSTWRHHTGLVAFCDTMEECWDHDAEARLSASCVMERISLQSRLPPQTVNSARIIPSGLEPVSECII